MSIRTPGRLLPVNPYLHDASHHGALQTYRGMASFAGGGPPGHSCGQCAYWLGKPTSKAATCVKHTRLMSGREGPKIPADAKACKYFASKEGK
jgi:hypothetical protein